MLKYCITVLMLILSLSANAEEQIKPNFLYYRISQTAIVIISNVPCALTTMNKDYPLAAAVARIDGAKIIGCYKKLNDEFIQIQWYKGDTSELPGNYFLLGNVTEDDLQQFSILPQQQPKKPEPEITL